MLFEFRTNDQELAVEIDQSKLQRAEADLRMAELTLTNKRGLHAKKIIFETETLQAEASRDIAAANVVEARLTVQLSESVLKNMKLYAPINLARTNLRAAGKAPGGTPEELGPIAAIDRPSM